MTRTQQKMIRAMRAIVLLSMGFSIHRAGPSARVQVRIDLANKSQEEAATKRQLERLLRTHDLTPWLFTSTVVIDEKAIPHSHPVLTLHTRHLNDDLLLLSTFIHEQSHRHFHTNQTATISAIKDLEQLFPNLPVGYPEGGASRYSSYEHLMIIAFERLGLIRLVGELATHQAMRFWATDHYRTLYRLVVEAPQKVWSVIRKYPTLAPPVR